MEARSVEKYTVSSLPEKTRLSDLPAGTFVTIRSRKGFKKALKAGYVLLNGTLAHTADYVSGGEEIEIIQIPLPKKKPTIELDLTVLYEDDYLAIIHKPAGILVSGNKRITVENALTSNLSESKLPNAIPRPEPIHRLDYPTSGCLLIGKTMDAVHRLNKMFEFKKIEKQYFAITVGLPKQEGYIKTTIDNKESKTHFKCRAFKESRKYQRLSLLELTPFTGRKHQLRIHLSSQNTPILGDATYGTKETVGGGSGLYLHAYSLKFTHPITEQVIQVNSPMPKKFLKLFPEIVG